jgi:hypothetical protein
MSAGAACLMTGATRDDVVYRAMPLRRSPHGGRRERAGSAHRLAR